MNWNDLPERLPRGHLPPRSHVEAFESLVDAECVASPWYRARYLRGLVWDGVDPEFLTWVKGCVLRFRVEHIPMVFDQVSARSAELVCAMRGRALDGYQWGVVQAIALDVARQKSVHVSCGQDAPWLWSLDDETAEASSEWMS